jgi:hypothetical protein
MPNNPGLTTNVPLVNEPFVGEDGRISDIWFIFLVQLWRRTGGALSPGTATSLTIADVLSVETTYEPAFPVDLGSASSTAIVMGGEVTLPPIGQDVSALAIANEMTLAPQPFADLATMQFANEVTIVQALPDIIALAVGNEQTFAPQVQTDYAQAPYTVTLGASPATYTATGRQGFHITGGAYTAISYKRGSTTLPLTAQLSQLIEMSPGDQMTITYSTAPTVTILPR